MAGCYGHLCPQWGDVTSLFVLVATVLRESEQCKVFTATVVKGFPPMVTHVVWVPLTTVNVGFSGDLKTFF